MSAAPAIAEDMPDYPLRSSLSLAPGRWRMRNGHTAQVEALMDLHYEVGGVRKVFKLWKGKCIDCDELRTWNLNGTYAAIGRHSFDILGPA